MILKKSSWIIFVIFCLFSFSIHAAGNQKNTAYRNFWHPKFQGERLDYCLPGTNTCGKPVANQYCKMMGYDYASQEIMAPNIGLTNYLTSREQCKGWRCNGFMNIGCAMYISHKPAKSYHYSEKRFVYPRLNQYRIDWCYKTNQGCGYRAANSFCKRMGYLQAKKFRRDFQVDATKTVGNEALCFGKLCNGFKYIICSR